MAHCSERVTKPGRSCHIRAFHDPLYPFAPRRVERREGGKKEGGGLDSPKTNRDASP